MLDCDYSTTAGLPTHEMVMRDLELHIKCVHSELSVSGSNQGKTAVAGKPDRLPRPTVGEGITEADWIHFCDKWARYKRSTLVGAGPDLISDQLWACCDEDLEKSVYSSGITSNTGEADLLDAMKKLAVRSQNTLVNIVKFLDMAQDQDETSGSFMARLKGQASVCNFVIKCTSVNCGQDVHYSDQMVKNQLVRGLSDPSIQEQVLAHGADNEGLDLPRTLKFIESKEAGKRSSSLLTEASGLNRLSEFQQQKFKGKVEKKVVGSSDNKKCGWCGQAGHGNRLSRLIRNNKCGAYNHTCEVCTSIGHYGSVCRSTKKQEKNIGMISEQVEMEDGTFFNLNVNHQGKYIRKTLPHTAYDQFRGWIAAKPQGHPKLKIGVALCIDGYLQLGIKPPRNQSKKLDTHGLPDTGAQLTVSGVQFIHNLGVKKSELIPLAHGVTTANNAGLGLIGGVLVEFYGLDEKGATRKSKQLCYVAHDIEGLYLSKSACLDLGLIGPEFPTIGDFKCVNNVYNKALESYSAVLTNNQTDKIVDSKECKCPKRELPPPAPKHLPYPAIPENRGKLKDWIIRQYSASAFNQCEHQPLPLMKDSPPIKLHIDPEAKPVAVHKARPVPIHWRDQVQQELERDVRIGVLERVLIGEPTDWCSPMVICPKTNGDPRRTVDLKALNKVAVRQTHPAESPFHQALAVPQQTIKTVLDAWQGYHSVPIAEEDRHYTTFLTPWGRFRYRTCPQGFLASGDAFNARYDQIISDFKDKTKCIDDTLLWSENLEQSFFRTCEYLTLCSNAGIVFNLKKFQFGQQEVDFLGFRITMDSIKPNPEYLEAITNFPRPRDVTGIRSWFGLVQQVAYAFSSSDIMLPFRNLLKPTTPFVWTQELQDSFDKSKEEIVKAVENGVRIYNPLKTTALCTDWSKDGWGLCYFRRNVNARR